LHGRKGAKWNGPPTPNTTGNDACAQEREEREGGEKGRGRER